MNRRINLWIKWALAALLVSLGVVLLGIIPLNISLLKRPLERAVLDVSGFSLSIRGPLTLRLGLTPGVGGSEILLSEPQGQSVLEVGTLSATVALSDLLHGRLHFIRLAVQKIGIDYCALLPGEPEAPDLADASGGIDAILPVSADAVELQNIYLRCTRDDGAPVVPVEIARVSARAPKGESVELQILGSIDGQDVIVSATGGPIGQLLRADTRFPVTADLSADVLSTQLAGEISRGERGFNFDLEVQLEADDPGDLVRTQGLDVPELGALRLRGNVSGRGPALKFTEFGGQLGETVYSFDGELDLSRERRSGRLRLSLPQLDLRPFTGTGGDSVSDWEDLDLGAFNDLIDVFDAEVELNVERIIGIDHGISDIELGASLANGRLDIPLLALDIYGSRARFDGSYTGSADCPELTLRAQTGSFALGNFEGYPGLQAGMDGLWATWSSCGMTPGMHLDSLHLAAEAIGGYLAIPDDAWSVTAGRVEIALEPDRPGRIILTDGRFRGESFRAAAVTGPLTGLLSAGAWPYEVYVGALGGELWVEGVGSIASDNPQLDAVARLEVPRVGMLHPLLDVRPGATLPLRAAAEVRLDEASFGLDIASLNLGGSELHGQLNLNFVETGGPSRFVVRSTLIDLQEIRSAFGEGAGVDQALETAGPPGWTDWASLQLPALEVDLGFERIRAGSLDFREFRVSGTLRDQHIDDARVSVRVEDDMELRGTLDLDLRALPYSARTDFSAENADIGRLLRHAGLEEELSLQAGKIDLVVSTLGDDAAGLLENVEVSAHVDNFMWRAPDPNSPDENLDLHLGRLDVHLAPGEPTVWNAFGEIGETPVRMRLEMPSLGTVLDEQRDLPLTLAAMVGREAFLLRGRLDRSSDQALLATLALSGGRLDDTDLPVDQLVWPLPDYEVHSDVNLSENSLAVTNLALRLGSSLAEGEISISRRNLRRQYNISLRSTHMQTDDFVFFARELSSDRPLVEQASGAATVEPAGRDAEGGVEGEQGVLDIASDFLSRFRRHNDLDLSVSVDELHAGSEKLGGARLHLSMDENQLSLQPVTLTLPGGNVDAAYVWIRTGRRIRSNLTLRTEALRYGGLLRLIYPELRTEGLAFADLKLSADTDWIEGSVPMDLLLQNADGYAELALWPRDLDAGVLDLWTSNLVFALLPTLPGGTPSLLNCMVARLEAVKGLMKTDYAILDSTETVTRLRGEIDFGERQLDLLALPQAKRERFLSVSTPIRITGPLDDFSVGMERGGLVSLAIKWWMNLVYVPYKWLTGERFPADGTATCFREMGMDLTPELENYFRIGDFSDPPPGFGLNTESGR